MCKEHQKNICIIYLLISEKNQKCLSSNISSSQECTFLSFTSFLAVSRFFYDGDSGNHVLTDCLKPGCKI